MAEILMPFTIACSAARPAAEALVARTKPPDAERGDMDPCRLKRLQPQSGRRFESLRLSLQRRRRSTYGSGPIARNSQRLALSSVVKSFIGRSADARAPSSRAYVTDCASVASTASGPIGPC